MRIVNYHADAVFEWVELVKKFLAEGIGEYGWGVDDESLHRTFHSWDPRFAWGLENDEGRLVGCLTGLCVPFFFNHRNLLFQESMWYVEPEFRGTGGGLMLYRRCESDCRKYGITRMIFAHTRYMTDEFQQIYKRLKFTYLETHYEKVINNGQ